MKVVNVAELKDRLGFYLRAVREGESVLVRDRDRAIARIEPAGDRALEGDDRLADVERVKEGACRLLRLHPLRAADAMQLSAALAWADGRPGGLVLHTLDRQLGLAAEREGFRVVGC